jgi:hypothetical protein
MFHTVMKVVESNPEIKVLKSEAIVEEKKDRKVITRNQSHEMRMEDRYYAHLLETFLSRLHDNSVVEINNADAAAWCQSENYAPTSSNALLSAMVRKGYLARAQTRGIFRLLRPASSNIGS